MKMDAANLEKPIIMATGTRLHNQVSRCYKKSKKIILAEELNALFQVLAGNIDATLTIDEYGESKPHTHRNYLATQRNGVEDHLHDETDRDADQKLAHDHHHARETH